MSGVAMATSKSNFPASTWAARSSAPTRSAPACLLGRLTGGEHGDANVLAGASWQADGAAHHLVGLARVDAEADCDIDGLVELRRSHLLDDAERFSRRVEPVAIERLQRVGVLLP